MSCISLNPLPTTFGFFSDPKFALGYPVFVEKRMEKNHNVGSWSRSPVDKTAPPEPAGPDAQKQASEIARLSR